MNLFRHFQERIAAEIAALAAEGALPAGLDTARIAVEPPRDAAHGDIATQRGHGAGVGAPGAGRASWPSLLAQRLLRVEGVATAEVAGPGFLNLRLKDELLARPAGRDPRGRHRLRRLATGRRAAGQRRIRLGQSDRAACTSATAAAPSSATRWRRCWRRRASRVTREYYVNDAGGQVDALARSLRLRYLVAAGAEPRGCVRAAARQRRRAVRRRLPGAGGRGVLRA